MCYRPITIKNPATGEYMQVPCGKCLDCLRRYQNDWSIRMFEEYKSRGCKGVFFTLTYDEAHVPKNYFVDGEIFRSSPDYGYGNVRPDKGYGVPKSERGVRRKYAEAPHACLSRAGVLRDDCYECNSDIVRFNERRSLSKHRAFMSHLQKLFADYFSLCCKPDKNDHDVNTCIDLAEECLNVSVMDDLTNSWSIDDSTGELYPKKSYYAPSCELLFYRERPIVEFNSVRKQDVQLWLKRNWTRFKRKYPGRVVSHFITSEYGPTTLRPHYHGCFFGATAEELKPWFKDWQEHYGVIVDFADLDMSKGGLNYVSKYCSKGSFEHPLCAKDFFYFYHRASDYRDVVCAEYHSKHYEKCIQWFGVDVPIVDPTFHLISKGLGVDWCQKDIPRCHEFEDIFVSAPDVISEESLDFDRFIDGSLSLDDLRSQHEDYIKLRIENETKWQAFHDNGATMEAWLLAFSERNCYRRNFISSQGEKVVTYALPKYYREKMFGVGLRSSYSHFIRSRLEEDYRQKLRQMDSDIDTRENFEVPLALAQLDRQNLVDRFNRCVDKFMKFYKQSKL